MSWEILVIFIDYWKIDRNFSFYYSNVTIMLAHFAFHILEKLGVD